MPAKTQKEMTQEVHQAIFGVPDSCERGMAGDVKDIALELRSQNGRIGRVELRVKQLYGMILGAAAVGGGIGTGIGRIFQ